MSDLPPVRLGQEDYSGKLIGETERGLHFHDTQADIKVWLPKSRVKWIGTNGTTGVMQIPLRLAAEKGLI